MTGTIIIADRPVGRPRNADRRLARLRHARLLRDHCESLEMDMSVEAAVTLLDAATLDEARRFLTTIRAAQVRRLLAGEGSA